MTLEDELLRLLRTNPDVRDTVRREILTEELLSLPARFDRLEAAQERTEARVSELAEAQARTEARLETLAAHIDVLTQRLTTLTERLDTLTARVDALTERLDTLTARVDALAEGLDTLTERLDTLTARVDALAEGLDTLTARVDRMATIQESMLVELRALSDWRRGDEGLRAGERYERDTVRHAFALFSGGRGAAERPEDLERLRRTLEPAVSTPAGLPAADDPFLADTLWQKGDRVAVVEVSSRVDRRDVERAWRRAETLRRAGINALPVVTGEDSASPEAAEEAALRGIAWRIGGGASEAYNEFRQAPAGTA